MFHRLLRLLRPDLRYKAQCLKWGSSPHFWLLASKFSTYITISNGYTLFLKVTVIQVAANCKQKSWPSYIFLFFVIELPANGGGNDIFTDLRHNLGSHRISLSRQYLQRQRFLTNSNFKLLPTYFILYHSRSKFEPREIYTYIYIYYIYFLVLIYIYIFYLPFKFIQ